jgi:hypothetical protein
MTADEMLQLGVDLVEPEAKFAEDLDKFAVEIAGAFFGSCHDEEVAQSDLKSLAHDAFGEYLLPIQNLHRTPNATTMTA